jgi:hypothetical protein
VKRRSIMAVHKTRISLFIFFQSLCSGWPNWRHRSVVLLPVRLYFSYNTFDMLLHVWQTVWYPFSFRGRRTTTNSFALRFCTYPEFSACAHINHKTMEIRLIFRVFDCVMKSGICTHVTSKQDIWNS